MLEIITEYRKGILFVRLKGSLISKTSFKLNNDLRDLIYYGGIKYVVYNMEELTLIDSSGIKAIISNCKMVINNNGKVLACGIQKSSVKYKIKRSILLKYLFETNNELSAFNFVNL
jgi:anti-anti-sigma factor